MSASAEKTVGCVLVAGLVITVASVGAAWLFSVAGIYRGTFTREPITNRITDAGTLNLVPLAITFILIGVLMMGGAVGYGLWREANKNKGPTADYEGSKVLARYAYSRQGQLLTAEWEIESADDPKYYVRMRLPSGESVELECAPQTYFQAGEGMTGTARVQGKWLGQFSQQVGAPIDRPE